MSNQVFNGAPITPMQRDALLRDGLAWVDPEGNLHAGQPDDDTFAEIIPAMDTALIRRSLQAANQAALYGTADEYRLAHAKAKVDIAAEWSRRNVAPFDEAHDQRVRERLDSIYRQRQQD